MFHHHCSTDSNEIFDLIIKLLTLLISVVAITFTAISIMLQKKHNRNAVKPIGHISLSDYENILSVKILNNGTGPLIIKSFKAFDAKTSKNNLIDLMPSLPKGIYWATFYANPIGFAITPNNSITLLQMDIHTNNPLEVTTRDSIRKRLSEISVELIYEDIYGFEMPINTKSLKWFGRHF